MSNDYARKEQVTVLLMVVITLALLFGFCLNRIQSKVDTLLDHQTTNQVETVTGLNYQEVAAASIRAWQKADQRTDNGRYQVEVEDEKVKIYWDGANGEKVLLSEEPIN